MVIGTATTAADDGHAFRWTPSAGMTDLGTLGGTFSVAAGINARGLVASGAATAVTAMRSGGRRRLG